MSAIIARRHRAGGGRDDGPPDDRRGRSRRASEFPEDRRRADRRARRPASRKWTSCSPIVEARLPAVRRRSRWKSRSDQAQRERIWKGRKAAFAAMGRVSPNYYVQDGVVPRTKLPEVLRRIRELEARSGLRIGNVFHAGDGNLHPLICYDEAIPGQAEHAETGRVRDPHVLHRSRRRDHRRARRRRRQEGVHAADVRRRRSRRHAARALRLRSHRHLQSRQGLSDAAAVRRSPGPVSAASASSGPAWRSASDGAARCSSRPTPPASLPTLKRRATPRGWP